MDRASGACALGSAGCCLGLSEDLGAVFGVAFLSFKAMASIFAENETLGHCVCCVNQRA